MRREVSEIGEGQWKARGGKKKKRCRGTVLQEGVELGEGSVL